MTGPSTHKNLQLVRQLFEIWLDSSDTRLRATGNELLIGMFYKDAGGDEYGPIFLDDASADGVIDVLRNMLRAASEPAPKPSAGRRGESKQMTAQSLRDQVALYARIALALLEVENAPASASASISTEPQSAALPDSVPELMRTMAIQMARGSGSNARSRPLWSKPFPSLGRVDNLVLKLRPDLSLEISNSLSGQVVMQTESVEFGPIAQNGTSIGEKFETWMRERGRGLASTVSLSNDEQQSAESSEA